MFCVYYLFLIRKILASNYPFHSLFDMALLQLNKCQHPGKHFIRSTFNGQVWLFSKLSTWRDGKQTKKAWHKQTAVSQSHILTPSSPQSCTALQPKPSIPESKEQFCCRAASPTVTSAKPIENTLEYFSTQLEPHNHLNQNYKTAAERKHEVEAWKVVSNKSKSLM